MLIDVPNNRSEAKTVPWVLTANPLPDANSAENEWGATEEAFLEDEAIVAPALIGPVQPKVFISEAQKRYYEVMLDRFEQTQATLRKQFSNPVLESHEFTEPISFPAESPQAVEWWKHCVKCKDPKFAHIASLPDDSVSDLLELLKQSFNSSFHSRDPKALHRYGAWLWAVLCSCKPLEVLGSEEVGELRELGKLAVSIQAELLVEGQNCEHHHRAQETEHQGEDPAAEDAGNACVDGHAESLDSVEGESNDKHIDEAKNRLSSMLAASDTAPDTRLCGNGGGADDDQTSIMDWKDTAMMIVDMVITILGAEFGQGDLLEHRKKWST